MSSILASKMFVAQHVISTKITDSTNGVILAEDPGVESNSTYFPWMGELRNMAGGIMSTAIVISVIAFIGGAIILTIGKLSSSSDLSRKSTTILVAVLGFAALIGGASGAVAFFSDIPLF